MILVTGAGGCVGNSVCNLLADKGIEITGMIRNKIPENYNYNLVNCNLNKVISLTGRVNTIIHIAATIDACSDKLIKDNIVSTMNLIEAAKEIWGVEKFIYISTISVFGETQGIVTEGSDIYNPGTYGMTKYLAERLVAESAIPMKMIIRLPRMLGEFVDLNVKNSGFLSMASKLLCNEPVSCFIPELEYNNFMHVEDLAAFLYRILYKKWRECVTVNLGAPDMLKMKTILDILKDEVGSTSIISYYDMRKSPACSRISIKKALNLGYEPMPSREILLKFGRELKKRKG